MHKTIYTFKHIQDNKIVRINVYVILCNILLQLCIHPTLVVIQSLLPPLVSSLFHGQFWKTENASTSPTLHQKGRL